MFLWLHFYFLKFFYSNLYCHFFFFFLKYKFETVTPLLKTPWSPFWTKDKVQSLYVRFKLLIRSQYIHLLPLSCHTCQVPDTFKGFREHLYLPFFTLGILILSWRLRSSISLLRSLFWFLQTGLNAPSMVFPQHCAPFPAQNALDSSVFYTRLNALRILFSYAFAVPSKMSCPLSCPHTYICTVTRYE